MTTTDNPDLDPVDKAALEFAMELARPQEGGARGAQLDAMLKNDPWVRVAQFAAYCCQTENLHLKPWEMPPCWIENPEDPDDPANTPHGAKDADGCYGAAKLLRQMRRLRISDWHPDPIAAIAAKRGE